MRLEVLPHTSHLVPRPYDLTLLAVDVTRTPMAEDRVGKMSVGEVLDVTVRRERF